MNQAVRSQESPHSQSRPAVRIEPIVSQQPTMGVCALSEPAITWKRKHIHLWCYFYACSCVWLTFSLSFFLLLMISRTRFMNAFEKKWEAKVKIHYIYMKWCHKMSPTLPMYQRLLYNWWILTFASHFFSKAFMNLVREIMSNKKKDKENVSHTQLHA